LTHTSTVHSACKVIQAMLGLLRHNLHNVNPTIWMSSLMEVV